MELNPLRAGLVRHPREYRWSSYGYRALDIPEGVLDEDPWYAGLGTSAEERQRVYQEWVESGIKEGEWEQIRGTTPKGRVVGKVEFQKEVGAMIGRRVVGESGGRPKKVRAAVHEKVL